MKRPTARILLVEDDRDLAAGLCDALELEGYAVTHAADGQTGLKAALQRAHELVILDAMLPQLSGFDVLRKLRSGSCPVPVLLLTARGQEIDKLRGFKLGADDYVTKPFSVLELLARIGALLRRTSSASTVFKLEMGEIVVDFRARESWNGQTPIELTEREFEVLETLAARRGEAVSRADLLGRIWGTADDVDVSTRTVDQHVAALRRKLGDPAGSLIQTVYGYGYRLAR
jgi:two-component system phosphate regulon response regulator PhoB